MTRLAGKVAIVTGAGSGIGRAIAIVPGSGRRSGCLDGRRQDKLDETAAEIRANVP